MGNWESYTVRDVLNYESYKHFIVLTHDGRRWKWTSAAAPQNMDSTHAPEKFDNFTVLSLANSEAAFEKEKQQGEI